MECLHTLQERVEETLSAAFEVYGRSVYFVGDDSEMDTASSVISSLLDASAVLDNFLETEDDYTPEDEEPLFDSVDEG